VHHCHRRLAALALGLSLSATACSAGGRAEVDADDVDARAYADGTYSARGWYGGLPSSIDVSVSLSQGVITDVEVTTNATDPTSLDFQTRFAEAIPDVVTGRPIDEVEVSRVAGSSGTPDGFNHAPDTIRAQAAR
jgi:uncharacterized protein with FMN-binding domain